MLQGKNIGLSEQELEEILSEAIAPEKVVDSEAIKKAIAKAIVANTERMVENGLVITGHEK